MNTLPDAIKWTRDRWDQQRPVPVRLHSRGTEGRHTSQGSPVMRGADTGFDAGPAGTERLGSPPFTGAFQAALDGRADATDDALRTVPCYHPLAGSRPARDCPECYGLGVKDVKVDRYRYPMSLALARLSKTLRQRRHPHPVTIVLTLADHGWDARATARSMDMHWDLAEAILLRSLRQLHSRYEEGPVKWTHKSESQQVAEMVA